MGRNVIVSRPRRYNRTSQTDVQIVVSVSTTTNGDYLVALNKHAVSAGLISAQQQINETALSVRALGAFMFAYETQISAFLPMLDVRQDQDIIRFFCVY